jgi:hypothetical protein
VKWSGVAYTHFFQIPQRERLRPVQFNCFITSMNFPVLLDSEEVLVPIRIDVVHKGAHAVNSLSWNLYDSFMSPEEFAWKYCADLALPSTTNQKIACQIHDQLSAYEMLVRMLRSIDSFTATASLLRSKLPPHLVEMEVKHGVIEYKDKFHWDPFSSAQTPEVFAKITCADIGLPSEMEPIIAYNIRESTLRWILKCLDVSTLLSNSTSIVDIGERCSVSCLVLSQPCVLSVQCRR